MAAKASTHSWLKLGVIVLTAVSLVVAHANPGLFYSVVKLEFVQVDLNTHLGTVAYVWCILRDSRSHRLRHYGGTRILNHGPLRFHNSRSFDGLGGLSPDARPHCLPLLLINYFNFNLSNL